MISAEPTAISGGRWVIIPTYNEIENVTDLASQILALPSGFSVLIVDDGSPDGTADAVESLIPRFGERVKVLRRTKKEGYGRAVTAGLKRALELDASEVFTMDCDFSHDPKVLERLTLQLRHSEVAIGSRYILGGRTVNWPLQRQALSAVANRVARLVAGLPTRDCTGGFRGYRSHVVQHLTQQTINSTTYTFLVETLFLVRYAKFTIGEIPIIFKERERGKSKVNGRLIFGAMLNLARIGIRRLSLSASDARDAVVVPEPAQNQ